MFLIGYTQRCKELAWHLKKSLESDKEKVILVEIKPEADGGFKDIFEVIHYDNQGVSHAYSDHEIFQLIENLLNALSNKLRAKETLLGHLPN